MMLRRLLHAWSSRRRMTALWPNPIDDGLDLDALAEENRQAVRDWRPVPDADDRVRAARHHLDRVAQLVSAAHHDIDARLAAWDPSAARVHELAAHHQLTDAQHALGRAQAALPSPPAPTGDTP